MGLFLQVSLIFLLYFSACPSCHGSESGGASTCTPPAYPDCSVLCYLIDRIGNGSCDLQQYNTEECGWDGGDCLDPNYPECKGADIDLIADGVCYNTSPLNTAACNFDGNDCKDFNLQYPDCHAANTALIGDGVCRGGEYDTEACGFDGGDCVDFNLQYPDCTVTDTALVGDGVCDGGEYDTEACAWDGGDCTEEKRKPVVDDAPTQKGTKYVNGKRHAGSIFFGLVILSGIVALFVFTGKKMVKRAQESAFVPVESESQDQIFPIEIPVAVADREIC